jgi:hypothetical protein
MESISLDFNRELNSISMTKEAYPNIMIDELEALSTRYSTLGLKIPEDTFVARALVFAPSEYASALTAENRSTEISGETLTLDDIRASMDTLYTTSYSATARAARENSQTNHEIPLSNVNSGRNGRSGRGGRGGRGCRGRGRFVCFKCGKAGHGQSLQIQSDDSS